MEDLRIWPTQADPDVGEDPADNYEVVDISGEGNTLMIGTLARCREQYPDVPYVYAEHDPRRSCA